MDDSQVNNSRSTEEIEASPTVKIKTNLTFNSQTSLTTAPMVAKIDMIHFGFQYT